jgi:IMP dehydrogenase
MKKSNKIVEALATKDTLLVPKYSEIESRKDIDITSRLSGAHTFDLPLISSPMDTVTEKEMLVAMDQCGGFGILHRYNKIEEQVKIAESIKWKDKSKRKSTFVGAAVGVTGDYLERAMELCGLVDLICLDVAHGHHSLVKEALNNLIKAGVKNNTHIMAGNVATFQGFEDLSNWGADSVRVGIGGGSICSTRIQTGHGVPNLHAVMECAKSTCDTKLIADGGVKNSGDIVKLLAAGADFVMCGSLLSGTKETPGKIITSEGGEKFKRYRGMASKEAQIDWKGEASSLEGVSALVPARGSVKDVLREIETGIRSGFSYSGARNLCDLRDKAEFIVQTVAGQAESSIHV